MTDSSGSYRFKPDSPVKSVESSGSYKLPPDPPGRSVESSGSYHLPPDPAGKSVESSGAYRLKPDPAVRSADSSGVYRLPPSPPGKVLEANAVEVCKTLTLGDEACQELRPEMTVRRFAGVLLDAELPGDAMKVLARAFPRREAVWWACLCVRRTFVARELEGKDAPLLAAEKWVRDPSEANRRAAGQAAEAQNHETPQALAAQAAFWSGGSLAPPEVEQVVPPGEDFTAMGVAGAVSLAPTKKEPGQMMERYRGFLTLAEAVESGNERWSPGPSPDSRKEDLDASRSSRR